MQGENVLDDHLAEHTSLHLLVVPRPDDGVLAAPPRVVELVRNRGRDAEQVVSVGTDPDALTVPEPAVPALNPDEGRGSRAPAGRAVPFPKNAPIQDEISAAMGLVYERDPGGIR